MYIRIYATGGVVGKICSRKFQQEYTSSISKYGVVTWSKVASHVCDVCINFFKVYSKTIDSLVNISLIIREIHRSTQE